MTPSRTGYEDQQWRRLERVQTARLNECGPSLFSASPPMPGRADLLRAGMVDVPANPPRRHVALAGIVGLGVGILLVGIATLGRQPDVPFSATVIAALGILWGATSTLLPPSRRRP